VGASSLWEFRGRCRCERARLLCPSVSGIVRDSARRSRRSTDVRRAHRHRFPDPPPMSCRPATRLEREHGRTRADTTPERARDAWACLRQTSRRPTLRPKNPRRVFPNSAMNRIKNRRGDDKLDLCRCPGLFPLFPLFPCSPERGSPATRGIVQSEIQKRLTRQGRVRETHWGMREPWRS
jgi:hypothetical protein